MHMPCFPPFLSIFIKKYNYYTLFEIKKKKQKTKKKLKIFKKHKNIVSVVVDVLRKIYQKKKRNIVITKKNK